jgi:Phosphoinositide phospholipase C, Ca2+-dependent
VLLLLACASGDSADTGPAPDPFDYPRDGERSIADIQMLGTHNSYHVETLSVPEWSFTHLPLDEQAEQQGVRAFELDVNYDAEVEDLRVFHVVALDQGTTCDLFVDCLATLKAWSDAHPAHHPLVIQLEMKSAVDDLDDPSAIYTLLNSQIDAVWPADRRIDPADVQRDHDSVRDGLDAEGWPTLGETRGQVLFGFDNRDWSAWATDGDQHTDGMIVFPAADGDADLPIAAWHVLNDPANPSIATAIARNQLVRTRADSDSVQALAGDTSTRDAALASGAHVISTDWPGAHPDTGYLVDIPEGLPSRCNPLHAPADCVAIELEDPAFMD